MTPRVLPAPFVRHPIASRRQQGFSLVEALIVLAIMTIMALLLFPAFDRMLQRIKIENSARETANFMRLARSQAVKRNIQTAVTVDYDTQEIYAFTDTAPADGVFDPGAGELNLGGYYAPRGVYFWGPGDAVAGDANASVGFVENGDGEGVVLFQSNGSVTAGGAFRLRDERDNFFEVRVDPPATARVSIQKYFELEADPNDPGNWWENGEGNHDWVWN